MACRVLNARPSSVARRAAAVLLLLLGGQAGAAPALACTGTAADGDALWQQASGFPPFKLLRQRLGPPSSCSVAQVDSRQSIIVEFPHGGRFTLAYDTVLESSSLQVAMPESAKLNWSKALTVLRATERYAAAPEGCGVAWPLLARRRNTGPTDAQAEGTACNCKARLGAERGRVVRLGFSLSC